MNWIIERDKDGQPVRMCWGGAEGERIIRQREAERAEQIRKQSLPMPAMREWATKHGLCLNGS